MSEAVFVALISGVVSLAGVVITHLAGVRKNEVSIRTAQAVTDAKLEELIREVREYHGQARRVPVVEEQIRTLNRRISDLESNRRTVC